MFESYTTNEKGRTEIHLFKQRLTDAVEEVLMLFEVPHGRDASIFKTKIEEAVFFGVRAVAAKPENHTHRTDYTRGGPVTKEKGAKNVTN